MLEGTADMSGFFIVIKKDPIVIWPISDFDPQQISKIYNIKILCNCDIVNKWFYKKDDFISDFVEILNLSNLYVTERRTYLSKLISLVF